MKKSIETKIRFNAILIYAVVAISAIAIILYLYSMRSDIRDQRVEMEQQYLSLRLTNQLIFTVTEAQNAESLYILTKNRKYARSFKRYTAVVDSLIEKIVPLRPTEQQELMQISRLLSKQADNIEDLKLEFAKENPLIKITERISQRDTVIHRDTILVRTITQDTIVTQTKKRKFFRRVADLFKQKKDSTFVVVSQRTDTVRVSAADSLPILSEVDNMAKIATVTYDENIRSIERQVGKLIASEKEISVKISALLLDIHTKTLDSTINTIKQSEKKISDNYIFSIIATIVALMLVLVFILLIISNINKGKAARIALEEANNRIKELMDSRHRLLLSVSHDIKTPLGSILGYLELWRDKTPEVKSMQNSARHILSMLENLLEFSTLEQGRLQKNTSDFNTKKMCDDIGEMFSPLAMQKGLRFSYTSSNSNLSSDQMKIKQIIINLVSNAIKYTSKGGVDLEMVAKDNLLVVKIADTGAGIPDDKLDDLYKPFTRVEANNTLAHGTGLGMYVVKGLLDLLDGEIKIDSKVGKGTVIELYIPFTETANIIEDKSKRIAIFDDDSVMVALAANMLTKLGHQIVDKDYDMVLTDMEMGDLSGFDILKREQNVPVVVMTGRSDFSQDVANKLGFKGYISKPFTIESLKFVFGECNNSVEDDFFGEDKEMILEIFRAATIDNYAVLKEALLEDDFQKAQSICHKMLPMFAQLGYPLDALIKMDANRKTIYNGWQDDVRMVLNIKV